MYKKIISAFLLLTVLFCVSVFSVSADTFNNDTIWTATIKSPEEIVTNFPDDIDDIFKDVQPGDTFSIDVNITSESEDDVDLYMANQTIKYLEEKAEVKGGEYHYSLMYQAPGKSGFAVIFDSDISGDDGFNQATDGLKEFFLLSSYSTGDKGIVRLSVKLDGPTLDNEYWDTIGQLRLLFAVVGKDSPPPDTGFDPKLLPYYIIMCVSGAALLAVAVIMMKKRKGQEAQ